MYVILHIFKLQKVKCEKPFHIELFMAELESIINNNKIQTLAIERFPLR